MKTSATSPLIRSIKHLCAASAAAVLLFGAATAKADLTIFSQDFNGYADGTALSSVPGWYNWFSSNPATIQNGKIVGGNSDYLLDFGSDIFSHGYSHVTIAMDVFSKHQNTLIFGVGDPSGLDLDYSQAFGMQHGSNNAFTDRYDVFAANSFIEGGTNFPFVTAEQHWVFDLNKTGNVVAFSMTYDGTPLFTGTRNVTITNPIGVNTYEFNPLEPGNTVDNIVVTGISPVPEPTSALLLFAGGGSLLARRRREAVK